MATFQTARIDFRIQPEQKELIERASELEGRSVTDFAISTLLKAAHEVIQRSTLTTLSNRDAQTFMQMLDADAPAVPNAAMKKAAERYHQHRDG